MSKFIFHILIIIFFLYPIVLGETDSIEEFMKKLDNLSERVFDELKKQETWDIDYSSPLGKKFIKEKSEKLRKLLGFVSIVKCDKVLETLVEHMDFTEKNAVVLIIKPYDEYPRAGEPGEPITKNGIKSVPLLIKILKETDPDDEKQEIKRWRAIKCLLLIYSENYAEDMKRVRFHLYRKGKYSTKMVKKRLLLEIEKSTGKEKKFLEEAVKKYLSTQEENLEEKKK